MDWSSWCKWGASYCLVFYRGGVLDGSFSREIKISADSSNGQEYLSFFKDTNGGSHNNQSLFIKTKLRTEQFGGVGPDVLCDKALEAYKGFLTGPLKIIIHKDKPIFLGNANKEVNIYANQKNGDSSVNFRKTGCDYLQGFAWIGSQALIVGDWKSGTKDSAKTIGRTFTGLKGWDKAQGVNLGELNGLILDRIDRISITSEGVKD